MRVLRYRYVDKILRRNYSTVEAKVPRQIFSAIQPTGQAHLGNYLGALKRWVDLQNSEDHSLIYAVADLHSITIPQDPQELQKNILIMVATVLACGIDTNKSIFFLQSHIPQHTELSWILGTLTTMPRLLTLPQYKEKCQLLQNPPVGIFLYPVLQAADIMLYRATHVPVGEDQIQQIQVAQHLVKTFNNRFGSKFPVPDVIIESSCGRIKSLANPTKKMSKSDQKQTAAISLMDEPDVIHYKIKRAVTDFKSAVTYEPEQRPGVSNLISIHSAITGKTIEQIVEESVNLDTGKYKEVLTEVVTEHLKPIRKKIFEYLDSEEYLMSELEKGAKKAHEIAEQTMKEVKERIGLVSLKVNRTEIMSKRSANC